MKTILLDGNLILQGLTDEGDFHRRFMTLWQTLQSSKLQGYITKLDLARLHRQLAHEIGHEASERLLSAFGRILKVWSGDRSFPIDVIVTENPQSFNEWDIPTLSVADFLKRYELDALLKQASAATPSLTKGPVLLDDKTSRSVATILLMLPFLLELWARRDHWASQLATLTQPKQESEPESSLKSGLAPHTTREATNVVAPLPVAAHTTTAQSPSARLLFADLPGIDISIENDLSLDVQIDQQGESVTIRLFVPDRFIANPNIAEQPALVKEVIAATIYPTQTDQAIAQLLMTEAGLFIVTSPAENHPGSTASAGENSQLIAVVQQAPSGTLTTWLNARPQIPTEGSTENGGWFSPAADSATRAPLVAVRSVDRYSVESPTRPQSGIEIHIDVKPDGNHTVTINPLFIPSSPTLTNNSDPQFGGGGAGIESQDGRSFVNNPGLGENYDDSWIWTEDGSVIPLSPATPPATPFWDGETTPQEGGDRPEPFLNPSIVVMQIVAEPSSESLYQDDVLGINPETLALNITNDGLFSNDTLPPAAAPDSTFTIEIRLLDQLGITDPLQVSSIMTPDSSKASIFPNGSARSLEHGLPTFATTEVYGI